MEWQNLGQIRKLMARAGVTRLYAKSLSPNDNSKNQPYFRGDLSILNVLPSGDIPDPRDKNPKFGLDFCWMTPDGVLHEAPDAKLILYPQYPEVRFSGFLARCDGAPSVLMNSRIPGRILFLGVTTAGKIIGVVDPPDSPVSREFAGIRDGLERIGVLEVVPLDGGDSRTRLLSELRRIHSLDWIDSKKLNSDGQLDPCAAPNCGGYTLEAELGVVPNGRCEPDFLGWEVKQHSARSSAVTLMTPEPDGGYYVDAGVEKFVRRFGYKDKKGRPDRLNFGGIHRVGVVCEATGLTMDISGFDPVRREITDGSGAIRLVDPNGTIAASWSLVDLLGSWKRKHSQAVYVPSEVRDEPRRQYRYHHTVRLGVGTHLGLFLAGLHSGSVYYDPGIKIENESGTTPKPKKRSQFRTKATHLSTLYERMEIVSVLA